jgi:hypothetical protein
MGDVVDFPGFDERQWLGMQTTLVDELTRLGMALEQAEWISTEWKNRATAAVPSIRISVPVTALPNMTPEVWEFARASVDAVEKKFKQINGAMLATLLSAVAELSAFHFNKPPPSEKMSAQIPPG